MNKRTALGILGLGAATLLGLGLYRPPTRPANNYGLTSEITSEEIISKEKPFINENLRINMEKARQLYPLGILEELEKEKPKTFQDLEDSVEACLDELPDFKIVCLKAHGMFYITPLPIIIDTGDEETPIATQDEINKFIDDAKVNDKLIEQSVCNPRRKQKLYDFLKVVKESRKKFSDPNYMEAIGLNSGNWRRADECIEETSKFFAYKISETIPEYLKTEIDLRKDVTLAKDTLLELGNLIETAETDTKNLKDKVENIMEWLSSYSKSDIAYEVIREFDNRGIHTIRYLARTGIENPERAKEMFNFINENKGNDLYFDLQAELSLKELIDSFRDYKGTNRQEDEKIARRLIEEINNRKSDGYD